MNGSTLHYLSGVADLVKLDIEAAALTLSASKGAIRANYQAAYAAGYRQAAYTGDAFTLSVSAGRFKAIANMFDADDEVSCTIVDAGDNPGLRLRSKRMTSTLREFGQPTDAPDGRIDDAEFSVRLLAQELISEIEIANTFTLERHPVLMGIKLSFAKSGLTLHASDSTSVLYEGNLRVRTEGTGSIVIPAQEALLGARLVGDGDVTVFKLRDSDAIIFKGETALFRSSAIAGDWPDMRDVLKTSNMTGSLVIEAAALRNIVDGSRVLDAGPDVDVKQGNAENVILSVGAEAGSFAIAAKGSITAVRLRYDRTALARVVKLGSELAFTIPDKNYRPTLITSERRKCWVMTRI